MYRRVQDVEKYPWKDKLFKRRNQAVKKPQEFCPLEDRDRLFEAPVSTTHQHCNMCAREILNPDESYNREQ